MLIGAGCVIICESLLAVLNGHHKDDNDDRDDYHPKKASWTELHSLLPLMPVRPESYHTNPQDPVWDTS